MRLLRQWLRLGNKVTNKRANCSFMQHLTRLLLERVNEYLAICKSRQDGS
jgi:hypothetical protein